ncbi:DUF3885 domain-containing protein [Ferruginibacter sp.]
MTAEQFNIFWASNFADTIPIQHYFRHDYPDRWFRIHSLPGSKRYPDNKREWEILLGRQNEIITDLLGNHSTFVLVTGDSEQEGYTELHPIAAVDSIAKIPFVLIDEINLYKLNPTMYEPGHLYKPMISEQVWQPNNFDNILKDIANESLRAFFVSIDNNLIVAPYDGGMDLILKDTENRNFYREKYKHWLPQESDGL